MTRAVPTSDGQRPSEAESLVSPTLLSSWQDLIDDVQRVTPEQIAARLPEWQEAFKKFWKKEDHWEHVVALLPVSKIDDPSIQDFPRLLLPELEPRHMSCVAFLCAVAQGVLTSYHWTNQLTKNALEYVAGCTNIARHFCQLKHRSVPVPEGLNDVLSQAVGFYPITIAGVILFHADHVSLNGDSYSIGGNLVVRRSDISRHIDSRLVSSVVQLSEAWDGNTDDVLRSVQGLLGIDRTLGCRILRQALSEAHFDQFPVREALSSWVGSDAAIHHDSEWLQLVRAAIDKCSFSKEDPRTAILEHMPATSEALSTAFRGKYDSLNAGQQLTDERRSLLGIWADYLSLADSFAYCWRVGTATDHGGEPLFGKTVDERCSHLRELLFGFRRRRMPHMKDRWREWLPRLWRPIGSILDLSGSRKWAPDRLEETGARQDEAIEVLLEEPDAIPNVVSGILDLGVQHWDELDPIILGLPPDLSSTSLKDYVAHAHDEQRHYHARRLLNHVEGKSPTPAMLSKADVSLLSAVETLVAVSRSRVSGSAGQIWLGDAGIESLWAGAIENANAEFNQHFDSQFGQDEHEHVAVLADALVRWLNATDRTARAWLKQKYGQPAFLRASLRRFPKTAASGAPQEGGKKGVQADLAILVKCNVPGVAIAERVTLIQAKKAERTARGTWQPATKVNVTQLRRLSEVSECAHYMFFLHSQVGASPLLLPARLVRDIQEAQEARRVPLNVVLRAAKPLTLFMVHDIIGLWTGDTRRELVESVKKGAEQGQGPRVLLEIEISHESGQGLL